MYRFTFFAKNSALTTIIFQSPFFACLFNSREKRGTGKNSPKKAEGRRPFCTLKAAEFLFQDNSEFCRLPLHSLPGVPVGKFFCPAHYMTVHVGDQVVLCFQLGQDLADTGFFFLFPGFQAAFFVRVTVSSLYVPCSTACIFIRICGKDTPSSIRRGGISAPSFFFLDFSLIL